MLERIGLSCVHADLLHPICSRMQQSSTLHPVPSSSLRVCPALGLADGSYLGGGGRAAGYLPRDSWLSLLIGKSFPVEVTEGDLNRRPNVGATPESAVASPIAGRGSSL